MKLINNHKNVKIVIEDDVLMQLGNLGIDSFPNECGGFLVGYYSKDNLMLNITDFILPKKQKKSSMIFERSVVGVKELFHNLFISKNHYYIGEWHTHPNGSSMYSKMDLNAMMKIVDCNTVNIKNPILLILGIRKNKLEDFSIYLYDKKGLYRYE